VKHTNNKIKKETQTKKVVEKVITKTQQELNQLLDFIREEKEVTHGRIMIRFGWPPSKTYSMLRALVQNNWVVKTKIEDGTVWRIIDE